MKTVSSFIVILTGFCCQMSFEIADKGLVHLLNSTLNILGRLSVKSPSGPTFPIPSGHLHQRAYQLLKFVLKRIYCHLTFCPHPWFLFCLAPGNIMCVLWNPVWYILKSLPPILCHCTCYSSGLHLSAQPYGFSNQAGWTNLLIQYVSHWEIPIQQIFKLSALYL